MELGIHPDAIRDREELFAHGVGYNSPMELLLVGAACKGNELLTNMHVSIWCPSTAIELMRHPYNETIVGAEFVCSAALAYRYRDELPMPNPCTVLWLSDLADRFLTDPQCQTPSKLNRLEETKDKHRLARIEAGKIEVIPEPVFRRFKDDYDKIVRKYS